MRPSKGTIERRSFAGELRASDAAKYEITGYAASFGVLSRDVGGYRERLAPGCFKRSLAAGDDVKALFNHDPNVVLGRLANKTLDVAEDERGLKFCVRLNPASQQHRDIYASVQRGDVSQCSFAFTVRSDEDEDWAEDKDEKGERFIRRTIKHCTLMDVSAVTYPAYDASGATSVQARSAVVDYSPSADMAAFFAMAKRKALQIREQIFASADAFRVNEQTLEVTPVFLNEGEKVALLDAQLRARVDEIGREILGDIINDYIN